MDKSRILFILGAAGPEMDACERLLSDAGARIAYAVGPDGDRVRAENASMAIGYRIGDSLSLYDGWGGVSFLIGCDGDLPRED